MSNADPAKLGVGSVLLSALCLLAATNGPAVTFSLRVLERPFLFEDWPFDLPIHAVAAVGIWRVAARWRLGEVTWSFGLAAVVGLGAWLVVSNVVGDASIESNRRLVITLGVMAFGVGLAYETLQHRLLAVFLSANAATLASAVYIVLKPNLAKSVVDELGRGNFYQGIFANRNSLGAICAVAIVAGCAVAWLRLSPRLTWIALATVPIDLWLLAGSRSATPVLALGAAAIVMLAAVLWRRLHPTRRGLAIVGEVGLLATAVALVPIILAVLGRDSGLSDRRGIWADVIDAAGERPVLGYGFWSFWDDPELTWPIYVQHGGVQFGSAHNSLLEVALGNGWPAAALLACVVAVALVLAARQVIGSGVTGMVWPPLLMVVLVEHATESFVLYYSYLLALLVAAACADKWSGGPDATQPAQEDRDRPGIVT